MVIASLYTKPWLDEKETTGTFRIYDRKFEMMIMIMAVILLKLTIKKIKGMN